jgi:hypothetical protein
MQIRTFRESLTIALWFAIGCSKVESPEPMTVDVMDAGVGIDAGAGIDAGRNADAGAIDAAQVTCSQGDLPLPGGITVGRVTFIYMIPSDQSVNQKQRDFWRCAAQYIQGWYRQQLGVTFAWSFQEKSIPSTSIELGCASNSQSMACFNATLEATKAAGFAVYADNTLFSVILQSNVGTYLGARVDTSQGGGFAVVGADLASDLIGRNCAPAQCRTSSNGMDHPGDFVTGGLAHELGHAFGLPHPQPTEAGQEQSVMAEHWRFPMNQFLLREINTLRSNPLFVVP